jgi:hypothetical protein
VGLAPAAQFGPRAPRVGSCQNSSTNRHRSPWTSVARHGDGCRRTPVGAPGAGDRRRSSRSRPPRSSLRESASGPLAPPERECKASEGGGICHGLSACQAADSPAVAPCRCEAPVGVQRATASGLPARWPHTFGQRSQQPHRWVWQRETLQGAVEKASRGRRAPRSGASVPPAPCAKGVVAAPGDSWGPVSAPPSRTWHDRNAHRSGSCPPGAFCGTPLLSPTTRSATRVPTPPFPTHGDRRRLLGGLAPPGTEGCSR